MDLAERRGVPGNGGADLEDLHGIVRAEDVVDHQDPSTVEHADADRLPDPLRQRVRPHERSSPQLVVVQERVAELEHLGAEPVLAGLRILLDEVLALERAKQSMDGRLREPEALGQLAHPQPG